MALGYKQYLKRASIIKKKKAGGGPLKYENANEFWQAACEYFKMIDDNPWEQPVHSFYGGECIQSTVPKQIPYTKQGLCIFMNITMDTFENYAKREGFVKVCSTINQVIRDQKYEGAAAGFFHPMIIARDLGLSDKVHTVVDEIPKDENTDINEELKKRGIPIPEVDIEDIEDI